MVTMVAKKKPAKKKAPSKKTVKKDKEVVEKIESAMQAPEKTTKETTEDMSESQKKRFEVAKKYAKEVHLEFKKSLKAVVVYGSTARKEHRETSDIDTFVVIDDTKIEHEIPAEVKERIQADLQRIGAKIDKNITIQAFMFLTEFWEALREVQPVLMKVLREGIPVYDVGIFMPAKRMLQRGQVPITREAVDKRLYIAPKHLEMAEYRVKSAAHYLEQAMASAGQAPLMLIGKLAAGKEDIGNELRKLFVEKDLLDEKYAKMAENIHGFAKEIEHVSEGGKIKDLAVRVDRHIIMTKEFIKGMEELSSKLDETSKSTILINTYKTFLKANVGALELKGIKPPEELKDLPKVMGEHFPTIKDDQLQLFDRMTKAITMVKKGDAEVMPEKEVYGLQEETKKFIMQLGEMLKKLKDEGKLNIPDDIKKKLEELEKESKNKK